MSTQHRVETPHSIVVAALYKFVRLSGFEQLQQPLLDLMHANDVRGTLLLAHEGINGTVSGPRAGVDAVLNWLKSDERLATLEHKESFHDEHPFLRTKVCLTYSGNSRKVRVSGLMAPLKVPTSTS